MIKYTGSVELPEGVLTATWNREETGDPARPVGGIVLATYTLDGKPISGGQAKELLRWESDRRAGFGLPPLRLNPVPDEHVQAGQVTITAPAVDQVAVVMTRNGQFAVSYVAGAFTGDIDAWTAALRRLKGQLDG